VEFSLALIALNTAYKFKNSNNKMAIQGYVDELELIKQEIRRNNAQNRRLRDRLKKIEAAISTYLEAKQTSGVKYKSKNSGNDRALILERKERRPRKGSKEKQSDVETFLRTLGVDNPVETYHRLIELQRGNPIMHNQIKIKNIK